MKISKKNSRAWAPRFAVLERFFPSGQRRRREVSVVAGDSPARTTTDLDDAPFKLCSGGFVLPRRCRIRDAHRLIGLFKAPPKQSLSGAPSDVVTRPLTPKPGLSRPHAPS